MTDDPAPPGQPRVTRVDDRLGLAVCRAGLSARTLVTYARDHITVRTPSKPDRADVNTIDLEAPPEPAQLATWVERFHDTIGTLGAQRPQVRWEEPLPRSSGVEVRELTESLQEAAAALGMQAFPTTVLLLDQLREPPRALGDMVPVPPPTGVAGGAVDRRWHSATVLYRYMEGEDPDAWRAADQATIDWNVEIQRELAVAERCQVWLTLRHGGPVARLHVVHDHQGLAAVQDVVVHPVVREHGIAAALTYKAVRTHLDVHEGSRVGIAVPPGSAGDRLARRLGFRPHATVWTLRAI